MNKPIKLQSLGNQIKVIMDDGINYIAYPTVGGLWVIGDSSGGGGEGVYYWPFDPSTWNMNNGHPEDNFRTAGRPFHNGMDMGYGIANITGTPIKSIGPGTVYFVGVDGSYGNRIIIEHPEINYRSTYSHMNNPSPLSLGASVSAGTVLGGIGTTGGSTGNHLHFEIYEIGIADYRDPIEFMAYYNPSGLVVP